MGFFSKSERRFILQAVESLLAYEPSSQSRNRKRLPEGREFLLVEVDDSEDPDDEEILAIAQNKELMEFLDQRFREPATLTLEEVKKKHGLT
ncbi:MAG TPA: hypothetical protein VE685_07715 [Thermoanaerobaculia bacterium]|nr:hypothetical protein [Thermoanaerobaculia bacterium]